MSRAVAGTAAAAAMSPAAVRVRKSFKLSLLFVRDDFVRVFFSRRNVEPTREFPRLMSWPQAVAHSAKSAMRGVLARRVWGSRCKPSSRRFAANSLAKILMPVTLPPGGRGWSLGPASPGLRQRQRRWGSLWLQPWPPTPLLIGPRSRRPVGGPIRLPAPTAVRSDSRSNGIQSPRSRLCRSLHHPSANQLANFAQQPIKLHRLGIELFTSGGERLLALAGKRVGRQADDRDVARLGLALQAPCRFPAVDDRHLQVHQDKVRPLGSRNLASFFAILGDQKPSFNAPQIGVDAPIIDQRSNGASQSRSCAK